MKYGVKFKKGYNQHSKIVGKLTDEPAVFVCPVAELIPNLRRILSPVSKGT